MATARFSCSVAPSRGGRVRGSEQQHAEDGAGGSRGGTAVSINCRAWAANRAASLRTCKLDSRAGAGFVRAPPAQSRVWRITAISSLDDEFREHGDGGETPSSLEDTDAGKQEGQVDLQLPRRRLLVEFTCNVCQTRTQRLVNPEAYKRGTVYVQCGGCEVYHQLVDNLGLVEEYDFREENGSSAS